MRWLGIGRTLAVVVAAWCCIASQPPLSRITLTRAVAAESPLSKPATKRSHFAIGERGFEEMLLTSDGQRQQWAKAPELVIVTAVLQFHTRAERQYLATAAQLSDEETDALVADLTEGLQLLTDDTLEQFAAVRREPVTAGLAVDVVRLNQIVVARYRDVRTLEHTIGFGGRRTRPDGTITAASIVLDEEFDSSNPARRLLRTHELGHALGYNHVASTVSIMNPRIGPEPTEFDRMAAKLAFSQSRPFQTN